jgi:hypothetical protein
MCSRRQSDSCPVVTLLYPLAVRYASTYFELVAILSTTSARLPTKELNYRRVIGTLRKDMTASSKGGDYEQRDTNTSIIC